MAQPKTVLITGCSSGIGRATARAFLDDDWVVYATARDTDDIADLDEAGCETVELDVTDRDRCTEVVDRLWDDHGRIDCLVNNAGFGQMGPLEDIPSRLVERQFDVNVHGPHRLTRAALPYMRDRGDGTVINLSSVAGRISAPGMGAYSGSKFALEAMSDALRNEVSSYGIDVVLVEPGPVSTAFADRSGSELDRLDRSGAYEPVYRALDDGTLVGGTSPFDIPAVEVAEVVLEAAVSPDPDARYPVGTFARIALSARYLPDGIQDTAYRLLERIV